MVGRFESTEMRREVAASQQTRLLSPGVFGRCSFVAGLLFAMLVIFGFIGGPAALFRRGGRTLAREGIGDEDEGELRRRVADAASGLLKGGLPEHLREEDPHLRLDFSLIGLLLAVLALCIAPPVLWSQPAARGWWLGDFWQVPPLLPGTGGSWFGGGQGLSLLGPPAPPNGLFGADFTTAGAPGGRGRIVDVRPGELRGWAGGLGSPRPGAMSEWPYGWQQPTAGLGSRSSWSSPLPSPYTSGPSGLPGVSASGGSGPSFGVGVLGGHSQAPGHGQFGAAASAVLPTEVEVSETYATFGVELQGWVMAMQNLLDKQLIEPLMHELDYSDRLWQQVLTARGWKLTTEAPRLARPGIGPNVQELSVFDRFLPRPLGDDPRAVELWNRRQQVEGFLTHPSFEPAQRQYVLDRLREWSQRGLANAMRYEWRPSSTMPTDGHILENLLIKVLNMNMDFASCFVSPAHAPPLAKHLGQAPVAFLRQITDQTLTPKPAPHYEVFTLTKVWKLRPGSTNLLEALALLLHSLKRQHSKSYQSFPPAFRNIMEGSSGSAGGRGFGMAGAGGVLPTWPRGGAIGVGRGVPGSAESVLGGSSLFGPAYGPGRPGLAPTVGFGGATFGGPTAMPPSTIGMAGPLGGFGVMR